MIQGGEGRVKGHMDVVRKDSGQEACRVPRAATRRALVTLSAGEDKLPTSGELDRLVLAIAKEGDRQAFALLFKYFAPRLKTFLMRSGTAATAAEEIAQETLLTLWRKASYFDPVRAGSKTWIFTIARNIRIDRQRAFRRPAVAETDPSEVAEPPLTGEAIVMAAEQEARVQKALGALSAEQALIVRLSFFHEKPQSEIARELGIPLGTVKSRMRLAMNRLRVLLEGTP
jgi:RNA polymerase sigma-70 factor, ECF subfamily